MTDRALVAQFTALGTTAVVVVDDERHLGVARRAVEHEIEIVDAACSRFRDDSELIALNGAAAGGRSRRAVEVSPVLLEAVEVALDAARATDGAVDPTLGASMNALGYDRDFASVPPTGPALSFTIPRLARWQQVIVDRRQRTVSLPPDVQLDLGATAKAWCADRAAAAAAAATGAGVLIGLGGDLAIAGSPPPDGWVVRIAEDHRVDPETGDGPVVSLRDGGLATSGTANRRWQRGDTVVHHLLDPATGQPVPPFWRTVTVASSSCVAANTASTAAMVLRAAAPAWLDERRLPARLVHEDGDIVQVGGWPADAQPPDEEPAWSA
jgi:thiamine biosynthesis lipoprotein